VYDASLTTQLPRDLWALVGVVWIIGAFRSKTTLRAQSRGQRLIELCFLAIAFNLLFTPGLPGPLGWRVVTPGSAVAWAGIVLTAAGIAFSIWARFLLGSNWSATVTVKRDHTLVRSGPYAIVRHPIYSGLILAALGTALAFGAAGGFLAPPILAIGWRLKSRREEEFMGSEFGGEYLRYSGRVKALVPYLW
jgi:protein-S-isoprenylcysteine O-methyltransferase